MASIVIVVLSFARLVAFGLAGTDCNNFKVETIDNLSEDYKADKNFYKKFVNANGIPVMGPQGVSDYALKECARIIQGVTRNLKTGFLPALIEKKERIALWAKDSDACSIPEVEKPCTLKDLGGLAFGNILILQETQFDCDGRGNAWIGRVLIHEFSHGVNGVFDMVDQDLQKSLDKAYSNAKDKQLWPSGEYGLSNVAEYFALGAQPWFHANEKGSCDQGVCDKNGLEKKDKLLYDLVARVFNGPDWLYKCDEFCDQEVHSNCCTTVYENDQFGGQSKQFCDYVSFVGADWNDRISSLKMTDGCVVELYDDMNYQGEEKILRGYFASLGGNLGMNDRVSSLKARPA